MTEKVKTALGQEVDASPDNPMAMGARLADLETAFSRLYASYGTTVSLLAGLTSEVRSTVLNRLSIVEKALEGDGSGVVPDFGAFGKAVAARIENVEKALLDMKDRHLPGIAFDHPDDVMESLRPKPEPEAPAAKPEPDPALAEAATPQPHKTGWTL